MSLILEQPIGNYHGWFNQCHFKSIYNCWLQTYLDPEMRLLIWCKLRGVNLRTDWRGGQETKHQMWWQKMMVSLSSTSLSASSHVQPSQEILGYKLSSAALTVSLSAKWWDEIRKKSVGITDVSFWCFRRRLSAAGNKVLRHNVSPRPAGRVCRILWAKVRPCDVVH